MKRIFKPMAIVIFSSFLLISCSSVTKEECMSNDSSKYEFGKEMATWSDLRGGISLERSVNEYQDETGFATFKADDPCVKKGFEDGKNE